MAYYPYQYFSGANVNITFNDTINGPETLVECAGISFMTSESNQPVYGYASHLYDAVLPGRRIIQGSFVINFHLNDVQNSKIKNWHNNDSFLIPFNINIIYSTGSKRHTSSYIDLSGCFLTSRGQTIQISENVILEEYSFIARNSKGI